MNDEEQLREWIAEYGSMLLRVCYLYLHDTALAEDAVQETFIKLWKNQKTFQHKSSVKTWLTTIAINTCRDMLRSTWFRHIDRRVTPDDLPQGSTGDENDDRITAELMNLPANIRDVMIRYYYVGMSTEEIASALGTSRSAVIMRLKRGRDKLKSQLSKMEDRADE